MGEGGARRARRGGGRPKSPGNAKNKVRSRILPSIILTPLSQSQLYSCSFASHSRLFCAIRHGAYKRRLCLPLRRVVTCFAVFGVERWGNLPAALAQDARSLRFPTPTLQGAMHPRERMKGGRKEEEGTNEEGGKGEWKVKLVGKNNTHHSKRGNRPRRSLPRKHFSSSLSLLFSFRPDISHSSQRANHTWTFIAPKRTSERTLSQPNKRTERIANPNMDDPPDVRGPTAHPPVFFSGRSTPSSLSCLPRSPAFWQCC